MPTIAYTQIISLTHPLHSAIPRWPNDPAVCFENATSLETDGYWLRKFEMGEHSGTHMNAPRSFFANGADVTSFAPAQLVLPAVIFDRCAEVRRAPQDALPLSAVLVWEQIHGRVPPGSLALLRTGWDKLWNEPASFLPADRRFPGFSTEAARFLVEERAAAGLGTDTPGLEPGSDTAFRVNRLVLASGGLALECLAHLDLLPILGATVCAIPLPLLGGSGSPVNVIAFIALKGSTLTNC